MAQIKIQVGDSWWMLLIPRRRPSLLVGQLIALGCAAVAVGLWFLLRSVLLGAPFITFFPFIVVATAWGGRAGGIALMTCGVVFATTVWLSIRPVSLPSALISSTVFTLFGALTVGIIHAMQVLVAALERAEQQAEVLAREMRHRVGNIMQLVQAIAQMTARSCSDLSEFMPRFEGRMRALSEAHRMSSGQNAMPNDLETMLRILLSAYDPERLRLIGPACSLDGDTAPRVALVIHELATNAAKYGALSVPHGAVRIEWHLLPATLELVWREEGGPPVSPPTRKGFGSRLIAASLAPGGGAADLHFDPEGLRCTLRLPRPVAGPAKG
ncbi:sensor histidine kinase [Rhizobium sp. CSW-27]|uniref:sensor histidine kinase n=1 Tax=Rhizobium sp. CSW-27 TaxID=2839985 RepID=UPI001C02284B|nr:sensor histidine kinase [Rhizobium sp. CSW-27]MBT9370517.1 sensor histidine kinase [Rhizobium sp. CSW-27]